ncbi:MAG TPA: copper-binding protein [Pyrinomonadaceae bacterium]
MNHFKIVLILLLAPLIIGCEKKQAHRDSEPEGPAAAVQTRTYMAVGTIKAIDPTTPSIEINHEDIKGLMPAMQMQFHVKDKTLLDGLATEDRVSFTIESGVGGLKIVAIHKL